MLPEIIGRQQALSWLSTNACDDAETCHALGLVHSVVDDDCDAVALHWANGVAKMQGSSIVRTRRLLNYDVTGLQKKLEAERRAFVEQVQTTQAREGVDRFLRR